MESLDCAVVPELPQTIGFLTAFAPAVDVDKDAVFETVELETDVVVVAGTLLVAVVLLLVLTDTIITSLGCSTTADACCGAVLAAFVG